MTIRSRANVKRRKIRLQALRYRVYMSWPVYFEKFNKIEQRITEYAGGDYA